MANGSASNPSKYVVSTLTRNTGASGNVQIGTIDESYRIPVLIVCADEGATYNISIYRYSNYWYARVRNNEAPVLNTDVNLKIYWIYA